ncbi:hypothetical protein M409DRAFT_18472 [Zasmidium cellare ATCC 36951]|uniref:Uncharacterized protein n=1 Tax=Zasmidium cellare ATCC 36951 TaxID=1080233 RepID=A0A6A6D129_ZASCE|nr:uncharacterized protein M409DRAFT_18472 [Zasmidium cellare ATCC 36951]KAF2171356.1 hypothetical protein M409DRAFT_18472 [Zasmidium cellare ATCC 36951]
MATAVGLILTAIGTGLSFVSMLQSNLKSADSGNTKITLACGQVSDDVNDADSISGSFDARMGNTAYEYTHDSEYSGQQTPYIKVTGNNDAICIAWLTVTWADGTDWVWSGGFGRGCGILPWHYSDAILGNIAHVNDEGTPHRPDCAWIDGDGSVGGDTTAFSVYLPHFTTENDGSSGALDGVCASPDFATYQNDDAGGITYWADPPAIGNTNNYDNAKMHRRDDANSTAGISAHQANARPSQSLYTSAEKNTKLIKSAWAVHSAIDLCNDDRSWGPSFVSTTENKFCDMSTKTLYDVCSSDNTSSEACFDGETLAVRGLNRSVAYNWKTVENWGPEVADELKTVQLS